MYMDIDIDESKRKSELSKLLKEMRGKNTPREISQDNFAKIIGVGVSQFRSWEAEKFFPKVPETQKIARYLGTGVDALLDRLDGIPPLTNRDKLYLQLKECSLTEKSAIVEFLGREIYKEVAACNTHSVCFKEMHVMFRVALGRLYKQSLEKQGLALRPRALAQRLISEGILPEDVEINTRILRGVLQEQNVELSEDDRRIIAASCFRILGFSQSQGKFILSDDTYLDWAGLYQDLQREWEMCRSPNADR